MGARDHDLSEAQVDVTYPPLDVLKSVAPDVWIVDSGPMQVYGMPTPIRMIVIRLANGDLLLHSPTRYTSQLRAELEQLGRVRHLIAPNIVHWTFAQAWQQELPKVILWAAPKLASRRAVQRAKLRIDRELNAIAPAEWRAQIVHILIKGIGFREVAFFHRASKTLILTDMIVNLEPQKLPRPMALLMRLAGAAAPNGGAPRYLRALILLRRKEAREAVRHMVALAPIRVLFAHGAWFQDDGAERLRRSMRWLSA
ncbi:MAG: DUF4336 domain-containing protein, partial [Planctomycetota bacterium]